MQNLFGFDGHLLYEVIRISYHVDDEEDVTDVQGDVAAEVGVELDVAHGAFPYAVEVDADQAALGVDDGAAGVAAGGVVGGDEADGNLAVMSPAAVVTGGHDITESLRYVVIEYVRVVLLHDALDGRERQIVHSVRGSIALASG